MSAETFREEPVLLDSLVQFDEDRTTGNLIIKREQHLPDEWLSDLRSMKVDSVNQRSGDLLHVAAIPVEVVDDLMRLYGFDVMNAPVAETLKMLNRYALDIFIVTNKRI
jgi:hypothetical protein